MDSTVSLGINRVACRVRGSAENPIDYWGQLEAGQITFDDYQTVWYKSVNDNNDPNVINPAGFHFSELRYTTDKVVEPLRQKLAARGEKLYIVLDFIEFGRNTAVLDYRQSPPEYGEFMLAAFQFLHDRYGWVPDAIEVINEPDNAGLSQYIWTGPQIGPLIVAAGDRLRAAGWTPAFIAPSTMNMTNAVTYFDQLMNVSGVRQYLTDFSYHCYGATSTSTLQAIGNRATQYGVRTGMLEHIGSGYVDLHQDLKVGLNSEWEQFSLAQCGLSDPGGKYFLVDTTDPAAPVIRVASRTYFLKQYFKYVRHNAVRIDATSLKSTLDPVAFVNPDGSYVVVAEASQAVNFTVGGLPPGRYGIFYTTGSNDSSPQEKNIELPEQNLAAGQALSTSIPGKGVITIYGK